MPTTGADLPRSMPPRLKVVFDTNVYIQAILNPSGLAGRWIEIAGRQNRSFELYTSDAILDELTDKLANKFLIDQQSISEFLHKIEQVTGFVIPKEKLRVVPSDPDDDMLFECAVAAGAQLIVSADKAVLHQNPYRGIGVCHPRDLKSIFPQDLA